MKRKIQWLCINAVLSRLIWTWSAYCLNFWWCEFYYISLWGLIIQAFYIIIESIKSFNFSLLTINQLRSELKKVVYLFWFSLLVEIINCIGHKDYSNTNVVIWAQRIILAIIIISILKRKKEQ